MISRRRPPGHRFALFFAALILAACGGPAPTATPLPGLGPAGVCSLVPDMDSVVGRTAVAPPTGFTTGVHDRCLWAYQADPSRSIGLTVGPRTSHAETVTAFGEGEPVVGLGEEARWWSGPRTLSVAIGERSFQVDIQLDDEDASGQLAIDIARAVLDHLP